MEDNPWILFRLFDMQVELEFQPFKLRVARRDCGRFTVALRRPDRMKAASSSTRLTAPQEQSIRRNSNNGLPPGLMIADSWTPCSFLPFTLKNQLASSSARSTLCFSMN